MLRFLRHIIQSVRSSESIGELLSVSISQIKEFLEVQACSIYLVDKLSLDLVLIATDGLPKKLIKHFRVPQKIGLTSLVLEKKEAISISNMRAHPNFAYFKELEEDKFSSFLGIPILYKHDALGVLVVLSESEREFDEAEEALLNTVAMQLAQAIIQSELFQPQDNIFLKDKKNGAVFYGSSSIEGLGIGKGRLVFDGLFNTSEDFVDISSRKANSGDEEINLFQEALKETIKEMRVFGERVSEQISSQESEIFDVYVKILDNPELNNEIIAKIHEGESAESAVAQVIRQYVRRFEQMDNAYFRERSSDIKELGRRIISHIGEENRNSDEHHEDVILVGEELSITHIAEIPEGRLKGIISAKGSVNSHLAILARSLGVPAVMGLGEHPLFQLHGKYIIVDGFSKQIFVSPELATLKQYEDLLKKEAELDSELATQRTLSSETTDGHCINLHINIGLFSDTKQALRLGVAGVGLYRTEVPFMMRDYLPSEDEQSILYRQILNIFSPRPVTMRLLDVGGDKQLPYFPIIEDNPFLGLRGIRLLLNHPEILLTQIRAMIRASEKFNNLHIMLPMVSDIGEVKETIEYFNEIFQEALKENPNIHKPKLGVMIEVPSAVYQVKQISKFVDFFSVGSNDLTQYLLAVDRNSENVRQLYNNLNPSVIKVLAKIVDAAHSEGKPVSICGEMAGNPLAIPFLVGLGFDSLSLGAKNFLRTKQIIRSFSMSDMRQIAIKTLELDDSAEIRSYLTEQLSNAGFGKLVSSSDGLSLGK